MYNFDYDAIGRVIASLREAENDTFYLKGVPDDIDRYAIRDIGRLSEKANKIARDLDDLLIILSVYHNDDLASQTRKNLPKRKLT